MIAGHVPEEDAKTGVDDTKYIFVTGGVVSSLGKGLTSAAIGLLLESHQRKKTWSSSEMYF